MLRINGSSEACRRRDFSVRLLVLALVIATGIAASAEAPVAHNFTNLIETYMVNRRVSEFPASEDLSTPETSHAAIHRAYAAEGDAAWSRLSVRDLAARIPKIVGKPLSPERAQRFLNAEILEVHRFTQTNAVVIAQIAQFIDLRWLQFQGGRWLNTGNDQTGTLEQARTLVGRAVARREAERRLASRPPIANPEEHLRPFVEFLRCEAADPQECLLKACANHRVVILGEVHHRPRYWAFNAELVKHPEFARHAGVICLELPSNDQALVEQFLAAPAYDPQPVTEMLRDNLWMGWPDQPMLGFFRAVWEVNQSLPPQRRLRIALVDMARPWKAIQKREDWRRYDVDRDRFMAENVLRDLREHGDDPRHALFIVGYSHATVNMAHPGGSPVKSAGWHLRQKLGETNLFVVFPHSPVMSNLGQVKGRIALGLFETAFAALNNRPMAFPLDHGPFGEQVFDASLDLVTTDAFRHGFGAYLYLGPLEDEVFSPLIPGFYTDEFVRELDRRSRIMFGQGLVEAHGVKSANAKGFIQWMSQSWGQPRREWSALQLGPLNAWQMGSNWEKR